MVMFALLSLRGFVSADTVLADGDDTLAEYPVQPGFWNWSRMSPLGAHGLLEGNSCFARGARGGGALASWSLFALASIESVEEGIDDWLDV